MGTTTSERPNSTTAYDVDLGAAKGSDSHRDLLAIFAGSGDTQSLDDYISRQVLTGVAEQIGPSNVPYFSERDDTGRVYVDALGGYAVELAQNYVEEVASMPDNLAVAREVLLPKAAGYKDHTQLIDALKPGESILLVSPAPSEEQISTLESQGVDCNFEVGKAAVLFSYAEGANQVINNPGFLLDTNQDELKKLMHKIAKENGGKILMENNLLVAKFDHHQNTEGQLLGKDFIGAYDDMKNNSLGSEVYKNGMRQSVLNGFSVTEAIANNSEARQLVEELHSFTFDIARQAEDKKANAQTQAKLRLMLCAKRDDGSSYVKAQDREWVQALARNEDIEFTFNMAVVILNYERYVVWANVKKALGLFDQYKESVEQQGEYQPNAGGVYDFAGRVANTERPTGCVGDLSKMQIGEFPDLSKMGQLERAIFFAENGGAVFRNRLFGTSVNNIFEEFSRGECRASSREGCSSYTEDLRIKQGELTTKMQQISDNNLGAILTREYLKGEVARLRSKIVERERVSLGGCSFCESCQKASERGQSLSPYVA